MSIRGTSCFWPPESRGPLELPDAGGAERGRLVSRPEHWEWLHELRNRFELAIEIVDTDLLCVLSGVTHVAGAAALRVALESGGDGALRQVAASILRSPGTRAVVASGLRVRLFPLSSRASAQSGPIGVLLLADGEPAAANRSAQAAAETDHRLDATGQWLVAAIEGAIAASAQDADQARTAERLAAIIDILDALSRSACDRDILALAMDALALWYDADVRLYRCDASGEFLLESCLPGVERRHGDLRLSGPFVGVRHDVFRLESADEAEALGWTGPGDTLFVPIVVDDSTDWLLTVSGAADSAFAMTLGLLGRVVSVRLTYLQRESADRLRARLRAVLTFGDAPFDATLRLALEVIARESGALSAQLATYCGPQRPPSLVVGWAYAEDQLPPFTEACTISATSHAIAAGAAAGAGMTAVLALRAEGPAFSSGAAKLAQASADLLGIWLSGATLRPRDMRVAAESEYSTEFVGRLADHLDRFGRLKTGGAVAVVLPPPAGSNGAQLDEVIQVVQEHVRSSDVVGVVGRGAGVFIPEANGEAAASLVGRLMRGAQEKGAMVVRVGITTFRAASESPETAVQQARVNAQREASGS